MTRTVPRSVVDAASQAEGASGLNALERIAFFLLLVVVGVRPLVTETYESAAGPIVPPGLAPSGPGPVFSLTMGSLILLAAVLTAMGSLRRGTRAAFCASGLEPGGLLAALGAAISMLVASNRRLALNASSDWLLAILMCAVLVRLLRRPWQIRLFLCVLAATAAAFAVQCALQRFVEYRDTIAEYEAHKAEFWQAQHVAPEDPKVQLYERRLYAREAAGYFPLSNVAGSFLMLAAWAVAASAAAKLRGHARRFTVGFGVVTAILATMLFAAVLLTASRGAVLAGVLTAGMAAGWTRLMGRLRYGWRARLLLGWLVVLAVAGAVVLFARQSPPRSSMGFRWGYWRNTSRLIGDYLWTGVGGQNFGRFYLQYKPVADPEEIRDPHNFFLMAFAQWGVIGAAGVLAMAAGASVCYMRAGHPSDEGADALPNAPEPANGSPLPWLATMAAAIFALRLWTILGNSMSYLVYATVVPLLVWCITFAVMTLEGDRFSFWSDRRLPAGSAFLLLAGGLAFLLHGMIDMAVFYPGTMTAFFGVLAAALALKRQDRIAAGRVEASPRGRACGLAVASIAVLAWVAHLIGCWFAPAVAGSHLASARRFVALGTDADPTCGAALEQYRAATHADTLDPSPPAEAAGWLLNIVLGEDRAATFAAEVERRILDEAARLIHLAQTRDPHEVAIFRTMTSIDYLRAERFGSLVYARAAVGAAREAISLYPESPADRVALAEAIVTQAGLEPAESRAALLRAAIAQYEQALRLDASRPGEVELRRWSARVRQELQDRIDELKAATEPASRPASRSVAARVAGHLASSVQDPPADN